MNMFSQKGFSLVEIALVLVVVGLIVNFGIQGVVPVRAANQISIANTKLDAVQRAMTLYVIQNGCLPCPAVADGTSVPNGSAQYGATTYNTGCTGSVACTATAGGVVPWVTLGLAKEDVIDAYGYFIDYVPSPGGTTTCTGAAGSTPALTDASTAMLRTPPSTYPCGWLNVKDAAGTSQTTAAAYVLISHGADGSGGFNPVNGVQHGDPHSSSLQSPNIAATLARCSATTPCIQNQKREANGANAFFDDIVRFISAPVIIQGCGANACGNPA
jgi:prepilin-type N-terminal cleavage/methylation domain-containing protein